LVIASVHYVSEFVSGLTTSAAIRRIEGREGPRAHAFERSAGALAAASSLDSSSGSDTDDSHDDGESAGEMAISPSEQESRRWFLVHAGLLDTNSEASDGGSEASEMSNDLAFIGTYTVATAPRTFFFVVHALLARTFMIPCPLVHRRFGAAKVMSPSSPSSKRRRRRPLLALQIPSLRMAEDMAEDTGAEASEPTFSFGMDEAFDPTAAVDSAFKRIYLKYS
jgi:hypothetical protein